MKQRHIAIVLAVLTHYSTCSLSAQEAGTDANAEAAELAMKLQNPVASLMSVPIQNN